MKDGVLHLMGAQQRAQSKISSVRKPSPRRFCFNCTGMGNRQVISGEEHCGAFVEILLKGSSKVTREELAQIPADRKAAFINEVAMRLRDHETSNALTLPMESRVLVGNRR